MSKTTKSTKLVMLAFATVLTAAASLGFPRDAEAFCTTGWTEDRLYYETPTSKFPVGSCTRACDGTTTCQGTITPYSRSYKDLCQICYP